MWFPVPGWRETLASRQVPRETRQVEEEFNSLVTWTKLPCRPEGKRLQDTCSLVLHIWRLRRVGGVSRGTGQSPMYVQRVKRRQTKVSRDQIWFYFSESEMSSNKGVCLMRRWQCHPWKYSSKTITPLALRSQGHLEATALVKKDWLFQTKDGHSWLKGLQVTFSLVRISK